MAIDKDKNGKGPTWKDGDVLKTRFWGLQGSEEKISVVRGYSSYINDSGIWQYVLYNPDTGHDFCRASEAEILEILINQCCPSCLKPAIAGYDGRCEMCWTERALNAFN